MPRRVNFIILPLFAFANAQLRLVGVDMASVVSDPVAMGCFFGLVLGKPIGIVADHGAEREDWLFASARRRYMGTDALCRSPGRRGLYHVHLDFGPVV